MDVATLHRRTVEAWMARVEAVRDDQWENLTPCAEWDVRALVNHVVGEERWTVPLMRGATIADVGHDLDGDLLGPDPAEAAASAAAAATAVVSDLTRDGVKVQLSYGEEEAAQYVYQLATDHLVHGWDLAAAVGADTTFDLDLVSAVASWFADFEDVYRAAGAIGPRLSSDGSPQADLLAMFGRTTSWTPNHAVVARFSSAFGRGDVDAIMALMTDDCVFEATGPAPDGVRHEGAEAVRAVWQQLFDSTSDPAFSEEESFVFGDRAMLRWRFGWSEADGESGHIRGVDLLRLRDHLVAEKLSYVKG